MPIPLTAVTLPDALADLTARDARLARIVAKFGPPPLWAREPGFSTLLRIILEQQVSLASAQAAFDRLLAVASPLTPERFLELDDATLKAAGFSRQKTRYGRELAGAILSSSLELDALDALDDEAVRAAPPGSPSHSAPSPTRTAGANSRRSLATPMACRPSPG